MYATKSEGNIIWLIGNEREQNRNINKTKNLPFPIAFAFVYLASLL